MRTRNTQETYKILCEKLDNNKKVYYSRFGDGDFYIMNGLREKMHAWSKELQEELTEAFMIEDPLYIRGAMINYPLEEGMVDGVFAPPRAVAGSSQNASERIENWLINNQKIHPETIFDSHIMIHYISVFKQDLMIDFLNKYIRPKKKMFINCLTPGKEEFELDRIQRFVGKIDHFVQVPYRDAYYKIDEWWPEIEEFVDQVDLCLPAAGMAGRVVQKRLWNLDKEIHSLDLGSAIDAITQRSTRTWIDVVGNVVDNLLIK
tara:strand:+ start:502 stop:1284 length:783 start_codon:yes stop_codon:yes gene_type:complete